MLEIGRRDPRSCISWKRSFQVQHLVSPWSRGNPTLHRFCLRRIVFPVDRIEWRHHLQAVKLLSTGLFCAEKLHLWRLFVLFFWVCFKKRLNICSNFGGFGVRKEVFRQEVIAQGSKGRIQFKVPWVSLCVWCVAVITVIYCQQTKYWLNWHPLTQAARTCPVLRMEQVPWDRQ